MTSVAHGQCSLLHCERKTRTTPAKLCSTHYARKQRGLENWDDFVPERKVREKCSVPGCGRKHSAKGFCGAHYRRNSEGRNMDTPITTPGRATEKCLVDSCQGRHEAKGLCRRHYVRQQSGVDLTKPFKVQDWKFGVCRVEGCEVEFLGGDLCTSHNTTRRKFNLTLDQLNRRESGVCDICGGTNKGGVRLSVDHDHSCCPGKGSCGKCVRGFLCSGCNTSIGQMGEDVDRIRASATYLEYHKHKGVLE